MNKNNYKVSDEYAYIFIHVPKTAGMTVNSIIDEINMKFLYICNHCGCKWKNNI